MTSTNKIEGNFYPLQHEEWVKVCKDLSPRARDVLYYIRTADPYSNGVEITAAAIAREFDCNRSTISRALKELDAKGYINLEILSAKVSITGKGLLNEMQLRCDPAQRVAKMQQPMQNCNDLGKNATANAKLQQPSLETVTGKGFQISKTYKDFLKTLSEGEREKFEDFCNEAIAELPVRPTLILSWLDKHYIELWSKYTTQNKGQSSAVASSPQKMTLQEIWDRHGVMQFDQVAAWHGYDEEEAIAYKNDQINNSRPPESIKERLKKQTTRGFA